MASPRGRRKARARPDPLRLTSLWQRKSSRSIGFGLSGIVFVLIFGVAGYVSLGWTPFDALYMVVITISGVGFGEVRAMGSTLERIHTMFVICFGLVAVAFAVGGFVALLAEGEIHRLLGHQRMRRQIEELDGHTIIAGFGRIGSLIAEELESRGRPFVIIERSLDRIPEVSRRGYLYVHGNATEDEILVAAGLKLARVIVSVMPADADNVFVTLMAKQLAPAIEIISRAEQHSTLKTLKQAGASHVVMPAAIGAHRIASLLMNPSAVEFAELVTNQSRLELEMDEILVAAGSALDGRSIAEADIRKKTNAIVVAIKRRDGQVEYPASNETPLNGGDVVVLLGRRSNLDLFRRTFGG